MNDDRTSVTISVPRFVEALCHERLGPIQARMEAMAAELGQVRDDAAKITHKAVKAAEVDRRVQESEASVEQLVRDRTKKERLRADRYMRRARDAEARVRAIVDGELDPYDLLEQDGSTADAGAQQ